ncbi:MAG: hypothetical protein ACE5KE_06790 [Methanosarcinales archaeon]
MASTPMTSTPIKPRSESTWKLAVLWKCYNAIMPRSESTLEYEALFPNSVI